MKRYKYFSNSEMKEICNKLRFASCFRRHPKKDFIRTIGEDNVNKLISLGYLKNSPKIENIRDYTDIEILEFNNKFGRIFDWHAWPFKSWFKIVFLHYYDIKFWIEKRFKK